MLEKYYGRLTARGKRRAVLMAGIRAALCTAAVFFFFYGAAFITYELELLFGVA